MCIRAPAQLVLKMELADHDLEGYSIQLDVAFSQSFRIALTTTSQKLESPNLPQTCVLMQLGLISNTDLDFEVIETDSDSELSQFWNFRTINHHRFQVESPEWHKICTFPVVWLVSKLWFIDSGCQYHHINLTLTLKMINEIFIIHLVYKITYKRDIGKFATESLKAYLNTEWNALC